MADVIDYDYVSLTGVIVPDTGIVKSQVEQEYKSAFGSDLNVSPDTPQGVLITAEVLARSTMLINNAMLANQINPDMAGGIFLDAILALTGGKRNPAVYSTTTCTLTGIPGTVIPAGSQARLATGEIFASVSDVILAGSGSGTATVIFKAIESGPTPVNNATLTNIVSNILGWEQITNTTPSVVGSLTQSDEAARELRNVTLGAQGIALPENIISALYLVPGVTSVGFAENYTDSAIVVGDKTLVPHSIYAVVNGGNDVDIANALLRSKSMGCAYNGDQEVTIVAPISKQSYTVKFDRADQIPILVKVTIRFGTSVENPDDAVKSAIMNYVNGDIPGEQGLVINQSVSPFEMAGAVTYYSPGIYVKDVQIALASDSIWTRDEIPINVHQIATLDISSITVEHA